tara:strand:- start:270 stop:443 length:174 start_codon:yes stop_codon:yes gene_type:complete
MKKFVSKPSTSLTVTLNHLRNGEDSPGTLKVNGNSLSAFDECGDCTLQVASAVFTRD